MELIVNAEVVGNVKEYVAKLNKRALRIGFEPMVVREVSVEFVPTKVDGVDVLKEMVTLDIIGNTPAISGWEFIARIEHDFNLGNVLRVAPGKNLPVEFWNVACNCDHCNTKRDRKDTFILRNTETGEYKQIGRQCVRDFIGYDNPADMVWWCGVSDDIIKFSELGCTGIRIAPVYSVPEVIRVVLAIIETNGYVSRRMQEEDYRKTTTSTLVGSVYTRGVTKEHQEFQRATWVVASTKEEEANQIIDWIKGWDDATIQKSEFNFNVHNMITRGVCRARDFGLMSCLPTLFHGFVARQQANVIRSNNFVGVVGEKIEVSALVKAMFNFPHQYGVTTFIIFENDDGDCFKWAASNAGDVKVGDTVKIRGTIKAHEEYKGRNQTCLTRCKIN